jgi:hypothetical protein
MHIYKQMCLLTFLYNIFLGSRAPKLSYPYEVDYQLVF